MAFASTFQLQQTTFWDSLHFTFSRRVAQLRRFHSSAPFKHKQWPPSPCYHSSIRGRGPLESPRRVPSPEENSTSIWIKSWVGDSRFSLLPKRPRAAIDYREGLSSDDDEFGTSASTGSSTMAKIVEKLKKFGYIDEAVERRERSLPEKGSVEDIFYADDGVLPNSRGGLSLDLSEEVRFPWEKTRGSTQGEDSGDSSRKKKSKTMFAELTLPQGELRRLRHLALRTKSKTKIGGAGVTKEIVDVIHEMWKTSEVVRLKCEGQSALNMKRMHEILERKTGGLVIWRSGTSVSIYRGVSYEISKPVKRQYLSMQSTDDRSSEVSTYKHTGVPTNNAKNIDFRDYSVRNNSTQHYSLKNIDFPDTESAMLPVEKKNDSELHAEIKYEDEMDKLLDDLGPRYTDWPGSDPLPVDADLLPGIIPGYEPPFRILPYGVRPTLRHMEGTALKRLARMLPPHFALGRSRQHHGLALAMAKLWEKSCIAKIALKRGVQLTTSERIAAELKKLTGGMILSRNKDFLVFYRGKDFLSREVSEALIERERLAKALQDEEEQARERASSSVTTNIEIVEQNEEQCSAGTLAETLKADAKWGKKLDNDYEKKMIKATEAARHADIVRKLEKRLSIAVRKVNRAERALAKVEESLRPVQSKVDPESITEEERFMFRKLGLRMKAFLLLGRRGVFDGTVENMHLHWKYRELVKIIVKAKTFAQVKSTALSLEAESGGILVSVDKISKGYAVIVFRGKDYQRPPTLRPKNLLTKRKALARSIELQRHEALKRHISTLLRKVGTLRSELDQMEEVKEKGDDELYSKLDLAYKTEDEETEDDEHEAYLKTFDNEINGVDDEDDGLHEYNASFDNDEHDGGYGDGCDNANDEDENEHDNDDDDDDDDDADRDGSDDGSDDVDDINYSDYDKAPQVLKHSVKSLFTSERKLGDAFPDSSEMYVDCPIE